MSKTITSSSNYDFFIKTDTSKYKGEWIAISGKSIVSHGKDAQVVYQSALKKTKNKDISLAKVPDQQILVLKYFR